MNPIFRRGFGYCGKKRTFRTLTETPDHEAAPIFRTPARRIAHGAAAFARQPVDRTVRQAEYRIAMRDSVKLYTAV